MIVYKNRNYDFPRSSSTSVMAANTLLHTHAHAHTHWAIAVGAQVEVHCNNSKIRAEFYLKIYA